MAIVQLSVAGFCVLLLISVVLGILVGPLAFFGYIIYGIGWIMSGHGIKLFWDFYINSTYAYALLISYYFHRFFWKVFLTAVDIAPVVKASDVNNIFTRFATYIWFALFSIGAWFFLGQGIMYFAEENTPMDPSVFQFIKDVIHDNPWAFQILLGTMVVLSISVMLVKIPFWLSREGRVESWIK